MDCKLIAEAVVRSAMINGIVDLGKLESDHMQKINVVYKAVVRK